MACQTVSPYKHGISMVSVPGPNDYASTTTTFTSTGSGTCATSSLTLNSSLADKSTSSSTCLVILTGIATSASDRMMTMTSLLMGHQQMKTLALQWFPHQFHKPLSRTLLRFLCKTWITCLISFSQNLRVDFFLAI